MGIEVVTATIYKCDFCGRPYTDPYLHGRQANITMEISGKAYNGDVGGTTVKEWWCGDCIRAVQSLRTSMKRDHVE